MPDTPQKCLDNLVGLPALWALIKDRFVEKESGKGLSSNDFTTALKTKLESLDADAEENQNAFSNITVGSNTVSADAKTDTFELAAGANVSIDSSGKTITVSATDTTYSLATSSANGLMSSTDKSKLDGIEAGAEANQNAYQTISVDSVDLIASAADDEIEFIAGSNVTITGSDSSGTKSITFAATDTTYSNATTSAAGLMSAADKTKLDGIDPSHIGENTIEIIKANGTTQPIDPTDKSVDLTIPTNNNQLTNGAGYQTASDVQTLIDTAIASAYVYKGSVAAESNLPSSGQKTGDVYNIVSASSYGPAGMNVAWNGSAWDALGSSISIDAMTQAEIEAICV